MLCLNVLNITQTRPCNIHQSFTASLHMAKNALRGREVTGLIPGRDKPMVLVAPLLTLGFVGGAESVLGVLGSIK